MTAMLPPSRNRRRAIEAQLRALVRHVIPGARIFFARRTDRRIRYSWNGRCLRPSGLTTESVCHEVAHVLVSDKSRRALPELGLGPDPYRHSDARRVATDREADLEELDACAMQLVLVRLLGLDEGAVMDEVRTAKLTLERLRALQKRVPDALPESWWERARSSLRVQVAGPSPSEIRNGS
jgi:hypothetical protein